MKRSVNPVLALEVAILLCVSNGCSPTANSAANTPNVLIISIESLRWDHLGIAGYSRPVSPNIDALASHGVYFRHAYAQSSWTRPSVASTFTSTYQSTHQVYGEPKDGRNRKANRKVGDKSRIPDPFVTLAESFDRRGYRCVGWTGNPQLWEGFGFGRGFDQYQASGISDREALAKLEQVIRSAEETPFFAFVHFVAAHQPYRPQRPFQFYDEHPQGTAITPENYKDIQQGRIVLSEADLAHNIALYDGAIQQVDTHVGAIVATLDEAGVAEETILIVMADHGEEFLDHGSVTHGHTLYDELIRVPLILAGPGIAEDVTIDAPVQNIDLFPTLLQIALNEEAPDLQGNSLAPLLGGNPVAEPRPVFSESGDLHSVRDGNWKYIFDSKSDARELYDLATDPYERENRADDPATRSEQKRLASLMHDFLKTNLQRARNDPASFSRTIPDEVLNNLEALGYLE